MGQSHFIFTFVATLVSFKKACLRIVVSKMVDCRFCVWFKESDGNDWESFLSISLYMM